MSGDDLYYGQIVDAETREVLWECDHGHATLEESHACALEHAQKRGNRAAYKVVGILPGNQATEDRDRDPLPF